MAENDPYMHPVARSLIGKFGETVELERYVGDDMEGGYATREYADPVELRVLLRPGDIDVPFTSVAGDEGTHDLWCLAYADDDLGEKDLLTRINEPVVNEDAEPNTYEVSLPRYDRVHDMALYQLDEADSRR